MTSEIENVAASIRAAAKEGADVTRQLTAQEAAVDRLLGHMPTVSTRSSHALSLALFEAKRALREAITATDRYASGAARFADSLAGRGRGPRADTGASLTPSRSNAQAEPMASSPDSSGFPNSTEWVALDQIDTTDRTISESDFGKGYTPEDLTWAHEAFRDVVAPGVNRGMTIHEFRELDAKQGMVSPRSYAATYEGFFMHPIRLTRSPNGAWVPRNGYHRLWVAQRLGLTHVPARFR